MSPSPQTGEVDGPASVIRVNNPGTDMAIKILFHGGTRGSEGEVLSILGASGSGKSTFLAQSLDLQRRLRVRLS